MGAAAILNGSNGEGEGATLIRNVSIWGLGSEVGGLGFGI